MRNSILERPYSSVVNNVPHPIEMESVFLWLLILSISVSGTAGESMNALLKMSGKRQLFLMSSSAVHGYEYLQHAEQDISSYFKKSVGLTSKFFT